MCREGALCGVHGASWRCTVGGAQLWVALLMCMARHAVCGLLLGARAGQSWLSLDSPGCVHDGFSIACFAAGTAYLVRARFRVGLLLAFRPRRFVDRLGNGWHVVLDTTRLLQCSACVTLLEVHGACQELSEWCASMVRLLRSTE
jgi:hypothetical protein